MWVSLQRTKPNEQPTLKRNRFRWIDYGSVYMILIFVISFSHFFFSLLPVYMVVCHLRDHMCTVLLSVGDFCFRSCDACVFAMSCKANDVDCKIWPGQGGECMLYTEKVLQHIVVE